MTIRAKQSLTWTDSLFFYRRPTLAASWVMPCYFQPWELAVNHTHTWALLLQYHHKLGSSHLPGLFKYRLLRYVCPGCSSYGTPSQACLVSCFDSCLESIPGDAVPLFEGLWSVFPVQGRLMRGTKHFMLFFAVLHCLALINPSTNICKTFVKDQEKKQRRQKVGKYHSKPHDRVHFSKNTTKLWNTDRRTCLCRIP